MLGGCRVAVAGVGIVAGGILALGSRFAGDRVRECRIGCCRVGVRGGFGGWGTGTVGCRGWTF